MQHRALDLLRRADFRRLYLAVAISELGDAFHYIALMWFALIEGGPLGVMAVRLADSVPALVFGFHGGLAADRWNRKRMMIAADLARGAILIPVAAAGLTGTLPLWGLVVAAFLLETATSYFTPSYSSLLPALVDRSNAQAANGLVGATTNALSIGGWAAAAGLLTVVPISTFFALNAASFLLSAAFLSRINQPSSVATVRTEPPRLREAFAALLPMPGLAASIVVLGLALTVSAGVWIAGVPELVRTGLHRDAGGFSLVMVGHAIGSIAAGAVLARYPVGNKARASLLAWILYLPAYGVFAVTASLQGAIAGAFLAGVGQSAGSILLTSAAQERVADDVLGRVMGLIALVARGAHASGLLLISPLVPIRLSPPACHLSQRRATKGRKAVAGSVSHSARPAIHSLRPAWRRFAAPGRHLFTIRAEWSQPDRHITSFRDLCFVVTVRSSSRGHSPIRNSRCCGRATPREQGAASVGLVRYGTLPRNLFLTSSVHVCEDHVPSSIRIRDSRDSKRRAAKEDGVEARI